MATPIAILPLISCSKHCKYSIRIEPGDGGDFDFAEAAIESADCVEADAMEADPKPDVEPPKFDEFCEFPLFPPVEVDALLTIPAAKEFRLAKLVFPMSLWLAMAANWLFGS